jgi:hypothetical protein
MEKLGTRMGAKLSMTGSDILLELEKWTEKKEESCLAKSFNIERVIRSTLFVCTMIAVMVLPYLVVTMFQVKFEILLVDDKDRSAWGDD